MIKKLDYKHIYNSLLLSGFPPLFASLLPTLLLFLRELFLQLEHVS